MYFNTATVLLAISSLSAAVPLATQPNDGSLEKRYSVVAVDGSSQTTSPVIETKTVDTTKYVTISPTPTLVPWWNSTQPIGYSRKARRTFNETSNEAIPIRRLARSAGSVNASSWNSLKSRSQNETSSPLHIRTTWSDGPATNWTTTNVRARSWNSTYTVPVNVPKMARSEDEEVVNWTSSALEVRSANATSLKARGLYNSTVDNLEIRNWNATSLKARSLYNSTVDNIKARNWNATSLKARGFYDGATNATGAHKFDIRSWNTTRTSLGVRSLNSSSIDLPPLPSQAQTSAAPDTVPAMSRPQYEGGY
ncbi:hypothetical protein PVAR5_7838 [Paecilomyces variotii No. 5]|uniref:Uncharacterized protein n=1 Tax=Byssochlamys spectabilis (strain No. 5 / NBRC 109023) TaxID=1356009 RepID=V5GDW8_BYSSN|nr:hypothetical protein PVAR5_7838 [Paecilomyces variotii No. 5]